MRACADARAGEKRGAVGRISETVATTRHPTLRCAAANEDLARPPVEELVAQSAALARLADFLREPRAPHEGGTLTRLRIHGPAPVVLAYLPLARPP
jgi:hypothetical protein